MTKKPKTTKPWKMTTKQYLAALEKLDLTTSGQATIAALGLKMRQCQRISSGDREVPETVALLLAMYLKHGVPAWVREVAENATARLSSTNR